MPSADPLKAAYRSLRRDPERGDWLELVLGLAEQALQNHTHGDLPRWRSALQALPEPPQGSGWTHDFDQCAPRLGAPVNDLDALRDVLIKLHPWRKGPFELGGVLIDTEWRSDWKWQRVSPHIDLGGERVLDIGCGNGYFGWRMLADGARLVVGVDPTLVFVMQWLACRHFAGEAKNYVLPLGIEDLPPGQADFDTVFSMGVLYHRRDHLEHLQQIRALLREGGRLVLETLVLPGTQANEVLIPESRYARMRNVWAVPGTGVLEHWLSEAGFRDIRVVDVTQTTVDEQRSTEWMRFESLSESLDPENPGQTLEGYPAPTRAMVVCRS